MPICLFGADASRFEYGYIAGFGSTNFADVCWTSKSGPHPFEQCKHQFRGPDGTLHEVRRFFRLRMGNYSTNLSFE